MKKNRKIDFEPRVRTNSRNEIKKIGQQRFDFYMAKELRKYKYFKGIKLKKRDWRKLESISLAKLPNSHIEWKASIKKKYKSYSQSKLKEFSHYLDYMIYSGTTMNELNAIIGSVIASSLVSAMFAQMVSEQIELANWKNVISMIFTSLYVSLILVGFVVFVVKYLMTDRKIANKFLIDYKMVIDSMIDEK